MKIARKFHHVKSLALITAIALGYFPQDRVNSATSPSTVTYTPSSENFMNPERGFMYNVGLIEDPTLHYVRINGFTVARAYVELDAYRQSPLSADFLEKLRQGFQRARAAGIKLIVRFSYNTPDSIPPEGVPDASINQVLQHIEQLKPVFVENSDVILVLQGGFIGAWGEWHGSANGLDSLENRSRIAKALLAALPSNRSLQIRYPEYIRDIFPQPLIEAAAFRGSNQARTGHHNDCFLANPTDGGTYYPTIALFRSYVANISPWVPIGGDTCQVTPTQQRTDCVTTQNELALFHWSYLSATWYKPNVDRWKREGCYNNIYQKLGYRLQLISSSLPSGVRPGSVFSGSLKIKNVGYASPFNRRNLQVVLRHQQTGRLYRLSILKLHSKTNDPRFWLPEAGEVDVKVEGGIPANAVPGNYQVLVNLPDPMPNLRNNPLYSIRLANNNTWEAQTGFNSLQRTVQVDNSVAGFAYTGTVWFR
ncbi:DUF4832 domain-containing protein [Merismopedia glauca]|uniref:DUF4832 domain-containing protein n=1 Tax=Merismopedia glauca CCAP 1448/3 TaxID=1296344 RepID=A0A2T1C8Y3_9CYAN|nr:DUF4832 domain-containing protein [Merismopedia glauca]PSB04735.1 hypothetical protein C7B64_02630 [Merismopedia glauca CCAP 1448/3]